MEWDGWLTRVADELDVEPSAVEDALATRTVDELLVPAISSEASFSTAEPTPARVAMLAAGDLASPDGRGTSWRLATSTRGATPAAANRALLGDLALGAQDLWLELARDDDPGLRWQTVDDVEATLAAVEPRFVELVLDAGADCERAVELLLAWASARGLDATELRGTIALDPIGEGARHGLRRAPVEPAFEALDRLARRLPAEAPELRLGVVSSAPMEAAGGGLALQLAFALASAAETLRRLAANDPTLDLETLASRLSFVHALGSETFLEIVRLRAARLLWVKVAAAFGVGEAALGARHHARGSDLTATAHDPWPNLLRSTAQTFAAIVGGADSILVAPLDRFQALGGSDEGTHERGARLALATQHVLGEESHLGRVRDPAGGAWIVEQLTDRLARRGWELFQEIEREGGVVQSLRSGALGARAAKAAARRSSRLSERRDLVVSLNAFVELESTDALPALSEPESSTEEDSSRLVPMRLAAPFEALRERVARLADDVPQAILISIGAPRATRARMQWTSDLVRAFGFIPRTLDASQQEVSSTEGIAPLGVLCPAATDDVEAARSDAARAALERLRAAGVRHIAVAGRPGVAEETWRALGARAFVHLGADHLTLFSALVDDLEAERTEVERWETAS